MHHAKSLKASRQTTEVVQPGKETFHLPAIRGQVSVIRWRPSRSSLCLLPFRDTMPYTSHRQILAKSPAIIALIRSQAAWTAAQAAYLDTFHSGKGTGNVVAPPVDSTTASGNPFPSTTAWRLLVEPPQVLPTRWPPFLLVQTSHPMHIF